MLYRRYKVELDEKDGSVKVVEKIFAAGAVVQLHDNPNAPFSFNLAVSRGEGKDPIYVNRVAIRKDAAYLPAFKKVKLGQQVFCEINIQKSVKTDAEGKPYENLWLHSFEWGKRPADKDKPAF